MLSIICPFYNEKENMTELAARLETAVKDLGKYEILFVDDASTDGGADCLRAVLPPQRPFRILSLNKNQGLSGALVAGFRAAQGDILITLDADLQNPPEEIPRLLNLIGDYDIVAGVRTDRKDTPLKKISSWAAGLIRRSVTRDHIRDTGCSLRVFRKKTLKVFYPFHGMHRFFLPVAEAEGFRIKQVPVRHEARRYGKSKYGLRNRILGPLWDLIAIRWILTKKIKLDSENELCRIAQESGSLSDF